MIYTAGESTFLKFYRRHQNLQSIDEVKLIYGLRIFMMDAKKMILIYILAFMLGITVELLSVQIGFILFRQVAFGLHFGGFWSCLIASCVIFLGGTYFFSNLDLTHGTIYLLFLCCVFTLTLLAPISSKKVKVQGIEHRCYLRRKMYKRFLVIFLAVVFLSADVSRYLVFGMLIETVVICYSYISMREEVKLSV